MESDPNGTEMLVIRKEQLEVLESYSLEQFINYMVQVLRREQPEATEALSDQEIRYRIRSGITDGKNFELSDRNTLERFFFFRLQYGPDFTHSQSTSWAREILTLAELTELEKNIGIGTIQPLKLGTQRQCCV